MPLKGNRRFSDGIKKHATFGRVRLHTVEELCNCTADELLCLKAFGPGCLQEVQEALQRMGLQLKRY